MTSFDTELFRALFALLLLSLGWFQLRIWKNIDTLSKDIKEFLRLHYECQKELPTRFIDRERFNDFVTEWRDHNAKRDNQWKEIWLAMNNHKHDVGGLVIRGDKP